MGKSTWSGPIEAGTVREAAGQNTGGVVLSQTNTIGFGDDGVAVDLFTLPKGFQLIELQVDITAAFDDTGTDLLEIGKAGAADHYADALDLASVGRVLGSSDASQLPNWIDASTSDVTIQGLYTGQNGNSAAGVARITALYRQL